MPQLRQNIFLKEWVVIATERAKRPDQLKENKDLTKVSLPEYDENCPFCPGNDVKFPNAHPIHQIGTDDDWKLRVIPNKYPALSEFDSSIHYQTSGYYRWMDGVGHHEVLIETPKHNQDIAIMDNSDILNVLKVYKTRIKALMKLDYIESVICFRNHGMRAGASLPHPHSQIIALPIIPHDVINRMNESIRHHEEHRECIFCKVMENEIASRERVVLETAHFVVFVPYAANSPFSMWVFPKVHASSYCDITPSEMSELSNVLKISLRKLYFGLNDPDYNYIIRSSPKGYQNSPFFHWYITIIPRLTRTAGFELGSGMFINPSIPEENAEYLRTIKE